MVIAAGAEIDVVQIGMAVELDHPHRALLGHRPQDGQGTQMVPAPGQGQNASLDHARIERLHPRHTVHQIAGVRCHIPQISTARQIKGRDPGRAVLRPDHGGQIAQLARTVARAGTVRRAAIPRRADQPNLHLAKTRMVERHVRQAHKGGHPCESRQVKTRYRFEKRICSHPRSSLRPIPRRI